MQTALQRTSKSNTCARVVTSSADAKLVANQNIRLAGGAQAMAIRCRFAHPEGVARTSRQRIGT